MLLCSVKSNAAFTSESISELFHSSSSMCFILLKFTSFLFTAFSIKFGFSFISDESYVSQNSPGDLVKVQYIRVIDQVWGQDGWILAEFFFCVFMDRDEVWLSGKCFFRDTAGSPERARWLYLARSGSQSHRAIWFILPARGASYIINIGYWPCVRSRRLYIVQAFFFWPKQPWWIKDLLCRLRLKNLPDFGEIFLWDTSHNPDPASSPFTTCIWLAPEQARWTKSRTVIGYPCGQDGAILPTRDYPPCPTRKFPRKHIINPLLTKREVKMAGY